MRKLNWKNIVLAAIYLILGGVFLIHPEGVEDKLCYVLSVSMGIMGLLYLVGHFFRKVDEGGHREGYGFLRSDGKEYVCEKNFTGRL